MANETRQGNRLIAGYNRMMEAIRSTADEADKVMRPKLAYLIEQAKERVVGLGELTREEAEKVGHYLRRDLELAAGYLAGPRRAELADWLRLDADLVERELLDLFSGAVDRTRLEQMEFAEQTRPTQDYRSGEITGIGSLRCTACGYVLRFHATGQIPRCWAIVTGWRLRMR